MIFKKKILLQIVNFLNVGYIYKTITGKEYQQVIICGIPRSGTSLAFNLFNSALVGFKPFVKNKKNPKSRETSGCKVIYRPGNYITKLPDDLFNVNKLMHRNILNKNLLIVVVTRDFREVIVSKHQWGDGNYYLSYKYKNTIKGEDMNDRGLKNYIDAIKELKQKRKECVEFIDYSNLVEDPNKIVDVLFRHKISNKGYGFWENYKSVYDKTEKSSKGIQNFKNKWQKKEHYSRIVNEFQKHPILFDLLEEFGYEKNRDWYKDLINKID